MSRSKYSKRMADGGATDDGSAAVLAQAPKSEYDADKIQKENDKALKESSEEASEFQKFKNKVAAAPAPSGGGGLAGGLASGISAGAKLSKSAGEGSGLMGAIAKKFADGGQINRAKYAK
jgi:hypothetical protein